MLPIPSVIPVAEIERLRPIRRPLGLVVERRRVPDDLVHELRDAHGVRGRAVAAQREEVGRAGRRVGDVLAVVGRVEVLAVPAAAFGG